ncbi:MAG: acetate uptake transporter [Acidimicrobiaceae bacterium]|nr:acetate uptake transporter [Acidimicrobiaceae bacterium]
MADETPAIADPAALGLAGFGVTTLVLSVFNAGILDGKLVGVVLPLTIFYGGIVQLLAGMWEFKRGNIFGTVAFTSYGAFWLSFYLYVHSIAGTLPAAQANKATGLFLLVWTIFTAIMTVAAFGLNGVIKSLFVILLITFILLTIGAFATSATWATKVGGYTGIITALVALYGTLGLVTNATHGREVIPMFAKKA